MKRKEREDNSSIEHWSKRHKGDRLMQEILDHLPTVLLAIVDSYASAPGALVCSFIVPEFKDAVGVMRFEDRLCVVLSSGEVAELLLHIHSVTDAFEFSMREAIISCEAFKFPSSCERDSIIEWAGQAQRYLVMYAGALFVTMDMRTGELRAFSDPRGELGFDLSDLAAITLAKEEFEFDQWIFDADKTLSIINTITRLAPSAPPLSTVVAENLEDNDHACTFPAFSNSIACHETKRLYVFLYTDLMNRPTFKEEFLGRYQFCGKQHPYDDDDELSKYSLLIVLDIDTREILSRWAFLGMIYPKCVSGGPRCTLYALYTPVEGAGCTEVIAMDLSTFQTTHISYSVSQDDLYVEFNNTLVRLDTNSGVVEQICV